MAAQHYTLDTANQARPDARECIERVLSGISPSDFGFKMQSLAAHILLRLGYEVTAVKRIGHPDIVAIRDGKEFRFEVEAEVTSLRSRKLTTADLDSLTERSDIVGYYALVVSFPTPKWILVPALKLAGRRLPIPNILLESLRDREYSDAWTHEHINLLQNAYQRIRQGSFEDLSRMALSGRMLL